jgi:hypothetical protein
VVGRSLSQWDSAELARQLVHDGIVEAISPQTVQRILAHHKLKPWRHHLWLSPRVPRDAAFAAQVQEIVTLYPRPLGVGEMVLCVDEKTSLQPRTRTAPTLAAQPGQPVRVEHEYARKGALNLFAGFDTRTGTVYAGVIALFPTMCSVRQWESTSHNVSLASGQHKWGWQEGTHLVK